MNRDAMNALREAASAAYAYLTSPCHTAMEFRAELVASLETLISALEEPLPDEGDDDDPGDERRPKRALRRFIDEGSTGGRVVRLHLVKNPPEET